MAFPTRFLTPSTWSTVGLGLTTIVFGLGSLAILSPKTAAGSLGVIPSTPESHEINRKSMVFLGIRDIALAVALGWFWHRGKLHEMGVLFTAWTLVCVADAYIATQGPKGVDSGIAGLCVGGVVCLAVGLGLAQCGPLPSVGAAGQKL